MAELMDTSPGHEVTDTIKAIASEIVGVQAVEKCIVRKMGYQFWVDMHIEVDSQMTVAQAHQIAHEVKDLVRSKLPKVRDVLVHIEPMKETPTGARAPQRHGLSSRSHQAR
jgi:divalent metal cation (Fe/Co/Zn/Cd) transporter